MKSKCVSTLHIMSALESAVLLTMPGQSIKLTRRNSDTYCHTFVSPASGATLQH